jgi:hypothetical protein
MLLQVLLLCGLLKDQHSSQQWRRAAAAVFVEARQLEQDICSDLPLQQGLLLAYKQLQQQQQQQYNVKNTTQNHSSSSSSSSSSEDATSLLLAKALLKHMQLEGLSPRGFAGLQPNQDSEPQVLSVKEQAGLLASLQAEQRLLIKRMQDLLLSPSMAPVVQMDLESKQVLLGPLQQQQQQQQQQEPAAAAAASVEESDLVLTLGLVHQLLTEHPDSEVRPCKCLCPVWSMMWKKRTKRGGEKDKEDAC